MITPSSRLWAVFGAYIAVATLVAIVLAPLAAAGRVPSPVFALLLATAAVSWIGAISLLSVQCVIRHVNARIDRWEKKLSRRNTEHYEAIMEQVGENRRQIRAVHVTDLAIAAQGAEVSSNRARIRPVN